MEKIKVDFPEKEVVKFYFGKNEILVNKYLSLDVKYLLINNFAESLILSKYNDNMFWEKYVSAKYELILGIVDKCTNVDISQDDIIENLISTGLWDRISSNIKNLSEFQCELDEILDYSFTLREIESNSMSKIGEKISEFINKVSEIDFSSEAVKQLIEELNKGRNTLSEIYPTIKEKKITKRRSRSANVKETE